MQNSSWAWYVKITCPTSSKKLPKEFNSDELSGMDKTIPKMLPRVLNSRGDNELRKLENPLKS